MSFRDALTGLSELSVSGVQHNYDIDAVPESISRAKLPVLLVMPVEIQEDNLFREQGGGFQTIAFSDGLQSVTYQVTHLLLIGQTSSGKGMRSHLPALIDAVDAYFAALGADLTLGGTLAEPARVRVEPGRFSLGDAEFIGCALRHTWVIDV